MVFYRGAQLSASKDLQLLILRDYHEASTLLIVFFLSDSCLCSANPRSIFSFGFYVDECRNPRFDLYPNPSESTVTVGTTGAGQRMLFISDVEGREVITCCVNGAKNQLDISGLPCGVYFMRLTDDRAVAVSKLIKL